MIEFCHMFFLAEWPWRHINWLIWATKARGEKPEFKSVRSKVVAKLWAMFVFWSNEMFPWLTVPIETSGKSWKPEVVLIMSYRKHRMKHRKSTTTLFLVDFTFRPRVCFVLLMLLVCVYIVSFYSLEGWRTRLKKEALKWSKKSMEPQLNRRYSNILTDVKKVMEIEVLQAYLSQSLRPCPLVC